MSLGVILGLGSGCGRPEPSPDAATTAEVRGEPIRGTPITPPPDGPAEPAASAAPVAPATATASAPALGTAPSPASGQSTTAAPGAVEVTSATGTSVAPPATIPAAPVASATSTSGQVARVAEAAAPATTGTPNQPLSVGFEKLASFQYELPEGPVDTNTVTQSKAAEQIPATIKALNNQFISLKGFMLPLKVEKGLVTELLIMRDQSMCCYGTVPRINEWVSVKMVGQGVKPIMDQAVTLFGKLKVGEMYENGYLVGIYALDGERMAGPLDM